MNRIAMIPISGLCVAVIALSGCGNKVTLRMSLNEPNKVVLNVNKNDRIVWEIPETVKFTLATPCSDGQLSTKDCTVGSASGIYRYNCPNCVDPEILVGSDLGGEGPTPKATASFDIEVNISCQANAVKVQPSEVSAAAGKVIRWIPVGAFNTEYLRKWNVNGLANACNEQEIHQGASYCTIKTAGTYNYSVVGYLDKLGNTKCTTDGSGTIKP